jgi:N-acetylmuramoyl-L-alanine amidase
MTKKKFFISLFIMILLFVSTFAIVSNYNSKVFAQEETIMVASLTTEQVKTVQTKLKKWGYFNGPITGYYGSLTTAAVKYFQRVNGIQQTGTVGPITAKALGISLTSSSSSSTNSNLYLLAKCIYAEARGEIYTGQVAIGAVILNRVKSPSFPNTISGVIYQPYAFTAVSDGQINLEPNSTAYQAAQDALNGWDPTYGSLFYYNPKTAQSSWIFSRPITVVIGNHTFAK